MLGHACCHEEEMHCQNCLQLKEHPCPAYLGVWNYYKFTAPKVEKFFFCPDDIERCVKGSRRK
jgi:hypothetical protein